jgi:hypothetical protein
VTQITTAGLFLGQAATFAGNKFFRTNNLDRDADNGPQKI